MSILERVSMRHIYPQIRQTMTRFRRFPGIPWRHEAMAAVQDVVEAALSSNIVRSEDELEHYVRLAMTLGAERWFVTTRVWHWREKAQLSITFRGRHPTTDEMGSRGTVRSYTLTAELPERFDRNETDYDSVTVTLTPRNRMSVDAAVVPVTRT